MTRVSRDLASFVANITISDIGEDVREKTGELLLDTIGCSVAAFTSPPVKALRGTYGDSTGGELATVVGTDRCTSVADAALINAAMARYLDYNDCYMGVTAACHPSDHIMALLSVAEAEGASGAELVEAIVTAYEIEARGIDECPVRTNGFDYVTWGVYSSVAAAGKLMQLSEEELVNAFGIAGASNNPLYVSRRGEVSMWKGVAHAYATHNAIQACQLARNGMTGPEAIFEGPFGFFESVSDGEITFPDQPDFEDLRITGTSIKSFACGYYIHSPVTGVLQLIDEHEIDPEAIDSIRIETFEHAAGMLATPDKWATDLNRETADHSIPYTVAVAVLEGEVTPDQYSERHLRNTSVHELMDRIEVEGAPELTDHRSQHPRHIPSITTITADREEYKIRIDCPLGHPENPMTEEQIERKMTKNCRSYLSDGQIQEVIDVCRSVTALDSVDPLLRPLVI